MSSCIKDLFEYDLVKICCKCEKICLKNKFYGNNKTREEYKLQWLSCGRNFDYENRERMIINQKKNNFENRGHRKKHHPENKEKIIKHNIEYQKNEQKAIQVLGWLKF